MRIVHFSDWHGSTEPLPSGDVYVCTGDMMRNFPIWLLEWPGGLSHSLRWDPVSHGSIPEGSYIVDELTDRKHEVRLQLEWQKANPARKLLEIPDSAPVVVVRGNHDYAHLADWFGGDVWEVTEDPTRTHHVAGLTFGGMRGVDIINGSFADELFHVDFYDTMMRVPKDIDVLLTHTPPDGILSSRWGSPAVRAYVNRRMYVGEPRLKLHCFGHVHGSAGKEEHDGTIYSNAAEGIQVIDL